jgi:uncharacterized protein (DUF1015 family)
MAMTEELRQKMITIGVGVAKIMLPKDGTDLSKWAVVACDQFTSQPAYWQKVEEMVGVAPSTFRIVMPEVYLESTDKDERIEKINRTMKEYLDGGVLEEKFEGMVLVDRKTKRGALRKGLILTLDLEKYDYKKGSKTLIRATEGTVESRIPPRLEIRKNALVELPHIMVLIDDPGKSVIEPLAELESNLIYDFELMLNGGHIKGWKIDDEKVLEQITDNLARLTSQDGFLFAMGDGNHSLATAKTHWENLKINLSEEEKLVHPARWALVELVNVHDDGLEFEPIHRVVYGADPAELETEVSGEGKEIEIVVDGVVKKIGVKGRGNNLAVGDLQDILDDYTKNHNGITIDYIHGEERVVELSKEGAVGFLLPGMKKEELFPTVEKDGALPRKTFSMGEAEEKRYYLEARKIV